MSPEPRTEDGDRSRAATSYRTAATTLLRETTLDAMRDLLQQKTWKSVTMSDVARAAGLSRQTIYNEFGSRRGLAEGYAMRLTDTFVAVVDSALYRHVGNVGAALREGFGMFFAASSSDPLVMSIRSDDAPDDLLRLITVDSKDLAARAAGHMAETFQRCWVGAPEHQAGILSTAIVQLALAYIPRPPAEGERAAADLAELLEPFVRTFEVHPAENR